MHFPVMNELNRVNILIRHAKAPAECDIILELTVTFIPKKRCNFSWINYTIVWFIKISTIYSFAGFCNFNINHFETSFCLYEWAQIVSKECIWQHQRGPMGAVYSFRILTEHIKSYFFFSDRKTECTMARFRKKYIKSVFQSWKLIKNLQRYDGFVSKWKASGQCPGQSQERSYLMVIVYASNQHICLKF